MPYFFIPTVSGYPTTQETISVVNGKCVAWYSGTTVFNTLDKVFVYDGHSQGASSGSSWNYWYYRTTYGLGSVSGTINTYIHRYISGSGNDSGISCCMFLADSVSNEQYFTKVNAVQISGKFKLRRNAVPFPYSGAASFPCNFGITVNNVTTNYYGFCFTSSYSSSTPPYKTSSTYSLYLITKNPSTTTSASGISLTSFINSGGILTNYSNGVIDFGELPQYVPDFFYDWLIENADIIYPYSYSLFKNDGELIKRIDGVPTISHIKLQYVGTSAILTITGSNNKIYEFDWQVSDRSEKEKFLGLSFVKGAKRASIKVNTEQDITTTGNVNFYEVFGIDFTPSTTFSMNLYKNSAENNRVDKTNQLAFISTINGALRESCSIVTPVFDIQYDKVPNFNYIWIPSFGRYYFITDITSVRNGLWRVELKCDVLMTYKDGIKALSAIIARQENDFNDNLVDSKIPTEMGKEVEYLEITNDIFNTQLTGLDNPHQFVITVVGRGLQTS